MTKNKVCIVDMSSQVLPYTWGLTKKLRSNGVDVDYMGSKTLYNSEFLDYIVSDSKESKLFSISSSLRVGYVKRSISLISFYYLLFKSAKKYDSLIIQFPSVFIFDLMFFLTYGSKVSYIIHNSAPHSKSGRMHLPTFLLAVLANKLLFLTNHVKEEFFSLYPMISSVKAVVSGHGLIPISPGDTPSDFPNSLNDKVILTYWGNVKPYKGVVPFAKYILSHFDDKLIQRLDVYGKVDDSLREDVFALASRNIHIHDGFLSSEEVKALFSGGRIFVLPYETASQSGILYTLLFYGQVFISSNVGDTARFLRENALSGLVYDINSPDTFYNALQYCISNYDEVVRKLRRARRGIE